MVYRFAYAYEVKCQILIARDLEYIDLNKSQLLTNKINEVSRMINSLNQKLKAKIIVLMFENAQKQFGKLIK